MRGGTQGHCWLGVLALTDLLTHVPCLAQSAAVLTPEHMVVHGWAVLLWGTLEVSSRRALGWHYVMGAGGGGSVARRTTLELWDGRWPPRLRRALQWGM